MSDKTQYDIHIGTKDPAYKCAYEFVDEIRAAVPLSQEVFNMLEWAIRAGFMAGVNWQRAQKEDK